MTLSQVQLKGRITNTANPKKSYGVSDLYQIAHDGDDSVEDNRYVLYQTRMSNQINTAFLTLCRVKKQYGQLS